VGYDDNKFSRRQIVNSLGVGLAATVVRPTFGENMPKSPTQALQDPTVKYPKPPFKPQSQRGLVSPAKWNLVPTMAKPATAARVVWPGGKP
jgi:hypothetical protein